MEVDNRYILVFKALADETRLKIIHILSAEEMCACNILSSFDITQPTLSYHMKILTESGLVHARKEGAWMRYSLNQELIEGIKKYFNMITTEQEKVIHNESSECDTIQ